MIPFAAMHLAAFGALWSGVTVEAVVIGIVSYYLRMIAVTAGYHRYFSHRSFKTGRIFQLLLAFLAQTSSQKGVLWWAAHHRDHHKYSDQDEDLHSPVKRGFWYAHLMWIFDGTSDTKWERIQDFARYPELRFLNRFWMLPPALLGFATWAIWGWSAFFVGFVLSTVLLWHGSFIVNSVSHLWGRRRFDTTDDSRNSLLVALLTCGEGWHNNHHHYQASARQGFYWWEIDLTYYVLKALSWVGLVWDLREPPKKVLESKRLDRPDAAPASMAAEPAVAEVAPPA
ncbi:MAG: acyl-CoA desaturase [Deltaproteobacteria bacterium]|nr:MAG: acyl-CoA desaturase [Deltaproteobacteria bacterium]